MKWGVIGGSLMWTVVMASFLMIFKKTVKVMQKEEYVTALHKSMVERGASQQERTKTFYQAI